MTEIICKFHAENLKITPCKIGKKAPILKLLKEFDKKGKSNLSLALTRAAAKNATLIERE